MTEIETSLDGILDRRVMLEQPKDGYRVAVDTVLLAAAVPVRAGDNMLDMGCGAGGAMLAVACRVAGIMGVGVDVQPYLIDLCRKNISRNAFASGLEARVGDIASLPADLHGKFDHVAMNPPYHEEGKHDVSANAIKRTANSEKPGDLDVWIGAAALALKDSGVLTLIHRADRQEEILACCEKYGLGEIEILPVVPKEGVAAKRVIMRAQKNKVLLKHFLAPLILHKAEGGYTEEAELILRHCGVLA